MMLYGHDVSAVSKLLEAFRTKGVDDVDEMILLIQDPESAALEYKAQALAAEAKLNRIKNIFKGQEPCK